ncbi:uncharacterized protein SOCE26_084310 [Sorangium cellulosum]|uniref:Uncharacterized protein n=1 Tax=Sorangium cellulosum TaxID=56 RepID=A0A2L0F5Z9_SORCE|nr:uncharacterized protein SOCE26_084310 [Sorangium cellulosum]
MHSAPPYRSDLGDPGDRFSGSLVTCRLMARRLGAGGALVASAALWIACAGETSVSVDDLEGRPCDSRDECAMHLGLDCIRGACLCPTPGDRLCCLHDTEPCGRECRPASECADAQDGGATPGDRTTCDTPEDCTKPSNRQCGIATCNKGVCGLEIVPDARSQREGNCAVRKCSETGRVYNVPDPDDVFNDGNECTIDNCDPILMTRIHIPVARGPSPASSGFCDGDGQWTECLHDEDCGHPEFVCSDEGSCVLRHCEDGLFDSMLGETALDCGGPCDPCPSGQPCNTGTDCEERVCDTGQCARAACDDHQQNGAETGVDCGGSSCDPCPAGQRCAAHVDCTSGVCRRGRCAEPSCDDGVMNGSENSVDCGGSCPCGTDVEQDP